MKFPSATLHFLQNIGSCSCPDEGLWIGVVCGQMFLDGLGEFCDAAEHSSPEAVDGEIAEEAFHHVQPGGACWSKVEVKPGIAPLPCLNLVMLMGCIVVADEVDLLFGRRASADQVKEANPFLMAVLVHAASDDLTVGCIQRSKERGGSIALVVMGQRLAPPFLKRKARLSAVQCLNLTLLIAREHDGMLRRVEVEAHDVVFVSPRSACPWKA